MRCESGMYQDVSRIATGAKPILAIVNHYAYYSRLVFQWPGFVSLNYGRVVYAYLVRAPEGIRCTSAVSSLHYVRYIYLSDRSMT